MTDDEPRDESDAHARDLAERLRGIEELPLPARAEALGRVHEELRIALEAGDAAAGRV
jgi:hypothetical protein